MSSHTDAFRIVTAPSGKRAYEAWSAVWNNRSRHTMIAAPTLELLAETWTQITGIKFNEAEAQHVYIVRATEKQ